MSFLPLGPNKPYASILVPTGALGAGVVRDQVMRGVGLGIDAIACDAGSTDSGPSYLARGVSKAGQASIRHDLEILIDAATVAGVPLLIGTCGTAGTDDCVDWTFEIVRKILREKGLNRKVVLLYSEQSQQVIAAKLTAGKVAPLQPSLALRPEVVKRCAHIVALMGAEPYIEAIRQGADIILGGRTTDTAVLAAVPLMLGAAAGPAWHAAKTAECGAMCTVDPRGGVLMRVSRDDFTIEPLAADNRCTPQTISGHMLYENSDPYVLYEPGGNLDTRGAVYHAVDARQVRVTGSQWHTSPYTMKLEGASQGSYQTIMLIGIRDPGVLSRLDEFAERQHAALRDRVDTMIGAEAGDYDISLRVYGWNAVSGVSPPGDAGVPPEVGILFVATADSQEMATAIAKTCNPLFFHFPIDRGTELPTYAFPFSPAEIERGRIYAFELNHIVHVADPLELVRLVHVEHDAALPVGDAA